MSPAAVLVSPKLAATLAARAALLGWELVRLADGSFVASHGDAVHALASADAADAFLGRLEAEVA